MVEYVGVVDHPALDCIALGVATADFSITAVVPHNLSYIT